MDIWIEQWKFNMILKILLIYGITVTLIFSSQVSADDEPSNQEVFVINYTIYPTYIEIETEYDDYNLTSVSCELQSKSLLARSKLFTCTDLEPCTNYVIRARARYYDNTTDSDIRSVTTGYLEPTVKIKNADAYNDSIYLSWTTTNKNCIKELKLETIRHDGTSDTERPTGNEKFLENLLPCRKFRFILTLTDKNDQILSVETKNISTSYVEPGPVQSVEFNVTNSVLVTWSPPEYGTCVEFYEFYLTKSECYETSPDTCPWELIKTMTPSARQLQINDLEGCDNYLLRISVNRDMENSSSIHEFSTLVLEPGPVVNLRVATRFSTNITLSWLPPKENKLCVQHYLLEVVKTGQTFKTTETSFTIDNLMPCATYEFRVAAVSLDDTTGKWENVNETMDYDSPSEVSNHRVTAYATQLRVTWEPPKFATLCVRSYRIAAWDSLDTSYHSETTELFHVIPNLRSCMLHTIQIIAVTSKPEFEGLPASFEATTSARLPDEPKEIDKTEYSRSVYIRSRNTDDYNNCEVLFVKITCDKPGAEIPHGEVILPFATQGSHFYFGANVEPLSPNTEYLCNAYIYNVKGWSSGKGIIATTKPDYPGPPVDVRVNPVSHNSFNIEWKPPLQRNGVISLYNMHIQSIGPKYKIPDRCDVPYYQRTQDISASRTDYQFQGAFPYFEYSIQVAALNEAGVGIFSDPVTVVTKPYRSDPVSDFTVKGIEGPDLSETYNASVTLGWHRPCFTHGKVLAFQGYFIGDRPQFEQVYFTWTLDDTSVLEKGDGFQLVERELKPEYNYSVTISVLVEDADDSIQTGVMFKSPAGIPPKPNISYNGDIDVFAAANPTESAFVRFSADVMNNDMGEILYVALLVSEKNCQADPSPQIALIDSLRNWPNVSSWADVQNEPCVRQYQTTPEHWSPSPVYVRDAKAKSIIQYVVGEDDCTKSRGKYCNGPLRPGVEYALIIRLFTATGYADANCMYFKTDSKVEMHFVLLMIISCLLIAFMLGFLYLWITKKIVWHGEPFIGVEEHTGDITSKNFLDYYDEIIKSDKLNREFKELTAISNELNLSNIASTSNETKNRYSNIFPYDKNRVILDCDSDGADYINASFINGYKRRKEYIATQGPKPETFVDFWRMVIQYNVRLVVMVTQFREGDKVKCDQYFPFINKEMRVGHNITVTCKKETHFENYVRREFLVEHFSECISRNCVHYLFRKWPDHDCPDDVTHLIEFVRKVKSEKIPRHSPIAVHCSAGVGRTGTFIGLDIIMQRLRSENRISIYDTVKELRFQRMKMVQTITQYQFLYKCAYYLVKKKYSKSTQDEKKSKPCIPSEGSNSTALANGNGIVYPMSNGRRLSRTESIM